ncbi:flagellar biosynthesis protein FlhA [Sphingomicrobium astaxanthinifaciens]|uniref:flagellar biosynthesis protein FlhA n=1 Tax=Sphingomicrobium astaxanthinifaciens TaxID=1227949 RepID=UPI001FCBA349|nr:flagellar biosynthesis protein FlhA [Sphingomicrobium astaxanthinifaciens]MCJ7420389.1 flagellar biosynthesis protein FlhA [Sphingomicrobium astaxanthinifaciens]
MLLPAGILTIIFLMVVPMPAIFLDIFFVVNIALSVAVLMAAMNAEKPLDFSAFPTVLLFATLLRLALNVASTRIVLLKGHEGEAAAGMVIEAFGAFLIGGDFAVGLFVFLILMIINLVVVTKGAGRVSEVSARFTLDALPGKQMAIDADLAAGLVTSEEAKARRREVATEADFYGSMDGASKFVKGDAIAALLILAINVIAGFTMGMASHDLTFSEAGERYVTLAVGDALVASIPALLLSIAAAVIVTRVSDSRNLTGQIGGQFADARIWLPVGLILGILGLIPAMPQSIFLPMAGAALGIWFLLDKKARSKPTDEKPAEAERDPSEILVADISETALVTVELGFGLVHLADQKKGAPLASRLTGLRKQLCAQLGFVIPQFRIRDTFDLGPSDYRITLGGVALGQAQLRANRLLAINTGEAANDHGIPGEPTTDPSFNCPALWIDPSQRDSAVAEGFLVVDAETVLSTHLKELIAERPAALLGPDQVRELLDEIRVRNEHLVDTLTPAPLTLAALTHVLRDLLSDGFTLAHPLPILMSLSQAAQKTTDHVTLIDLVRADLGSMLVGQICGPYEKLPVITLAAELERMVAEGPRDPANGKLLLAPELAGAIGDEIAEIVASRDAAHPSPALIVQPAVRRALAELLKLRCPQGRVISINELPQSQPIDVIAVVGQQNEVQTPPMIAAPQTPANEPSTRKEVV